MSAALGDERAFLEFVDRATEALRHGDLEKAEQGVDAALAIRPGDSRAQTVLGLLFFKQDRFAEACAAFTTVVQSQPSNASARVNLGLSQLKRGAYAEAALELERALVLDPSNTRARGYLGLAYARKGDRLRAREAFAAAGRADLASAVAERRSGREGGADEEGLVRFAAERALPESGQPLRLGKDGVLCVSTAEGVCIRRERWLAMHGAVVLEPAPEADLLGSALLAASGGGDIVAARGDGHFEVIPLRSDVLYVAAPAIYAWTRGLRAEAGHAPGSSRLCALRLAGRGVAVVRTASPLVTARVGELREALVSREALVGWTGGVRVRVLGGELGVRIRGEGAVLLGSGGSLL